MFHARFPPRNVRQQALAAAIYGLRQTMCRRRSLASCPDFNALAPAPSGAILLAVQHNRPGKRSIKATHAGLKPITFKHIDLVIIFSEMHGWCWPHYMVVVMPWSSISRREVAKAARHHVALGKTSDYRATGKADNLPFPSQSVLARHSDKVVLSSG
jgi:hypothetical protein